MRIAGSVGVDRDLDERVLIAELDDAGQRGAGGLRVVAARGVLPQLGRAFARVVAQAALGLGGGDLGEHVGLVDLLDRESAHADVAIGASHLNKDGSVVGGQSPDGFGADANVAVAVLGAKEVGDPHGRGGIYAVQPLVDKRRPQPSTNESNSSTTSTSLKSLGVNTRRMPSSPSAA